VSDATWWEWGGKEWSTNAVTCWQRILGMNIRYCTHMCIWLNYITFLDVKFRNYDTIHKSHIKIPHSKQKVRSISEKYHGPSRPGLYPPISSYLLLILFTNSSSTSPQNAQKNKIELRIIQRRKNSRQKVGLGVFGQNRKKGVSSLHTSIARTRRKWKREEYMLLDDAGKKER
jgi:hypothetical protein